MSATRDETATNAVSNSGEPFHSKMPPSVPMFTSGHKPGVIASEADAAPEFTAKVLPPGTAPASRTFQPQNDAIDPESVRQSALDTISGPTSEDLGAGVIPGGETSAELRHDGQHHRKRERDGLVGVGAGTTK